MPASHTGPGNCFVDANIAMQGYHLMGCPPQQLASNINVLNGLPVYSGLPGYNFIPYPQMRHMVSPYELKAASPYHHPLLRRDAFYSPYRSVVAEDPSRTSKVASRESTSALKSWLNEHLKNPYPTKGEKIMLAIVTRMTLTQVSTWFANARRRLKKENRVSWMSKSKSDEEDDDEEGESEEDLALQKSISSVSDEEDEIDPETVDEEETCQAPEPGCASGALDTGLPDGVVEQQKESCCSADVFVEDKQGTSESVKDNKNAGSVQKQKIWSLAEIATSKTDTKPAAAYHGITNSGVDVGKLWLHWASRNGLYLPANYDFLKQDM